MVDSTKLVGYMNQSIGIQQTRLPSCTCLATSAKRRCCEPTSAQGREGYQCCCGQPVLAIQQEAWILLWTCAGMQDTRKALGLLQNVGAVQKAGEEGGARSLCTLHGRRVAARRPAHRLCGV